MSDEIDNLIEDGSAEAVAEDIVRLWEETQIGKRDLVVRFEELAEKVGGKMPNVQGCDDDGEDIEDEDGDGEEASRLAERPVSKQVTKEPELEIDENE